ncbi:MAG: DcrB-related protein [Candidatus Zixiibacteriota bacterium]
MPQFSNQFSVELPGEWKDVTTYQFMGPEDSGVLHMLNLSIDPTPDEEDLYDYAQEFFAQAKESMPGADILKEEQRTLENGRSVYEFVVKWIPTDDNIIYKKIVCMLHEGKGYIFIANFSKKTIKTIGVEVERIIESLMPRSIMD